MCIHHGVRRYYIFLAPPFMESYNLARSNINVLAAQPFYLVKRFLIWSNIRCVFVYCLHDDLAFKLKLKTRTSSVCSSHEPKRHRIVENIFIFKSIRVASFFLFTSSEISFPIRSFTILIQFDISFSLSLATFNTYLAIVRWAQFLSSVFFLSLLFRLSSANCEC